MKMPEPMTAPIPNAIKLHGPSVLFNRLPGSSDTAISASILRVSRSRLSFGTRHLALTLALHHLFDFLLHRAARHAGCPFGLRRGFLARCPLQFLAFEYFFAFSIH